MPPRKPASSSKRALEEKLAAASTLNNANDRVEAKVDAVAEFLLAQKE